VKYSFKSDYCELAHPEVLKALINVGNKQFDGYGLDEYSLRAAEMIKKKINAPDADVHFISGGTHANLTVISSILRPYEAVIAPDNGHIFVHEAGAIEATGHKICTAPGVNGKLEATDIEEILITHDDEHMVSPKLVYISQTTETGTVYTKSQLQEISKICRKHNLILFIDGARLNVAMNSYVNDLSYADITNLVDVFYIGGTKNGALYGEAIVITNEAIKKDFRIILKQRGALLSKGAAIAIQFEALLKDDLMDKIAKHANSMATKMAKGITDAGYELLSPVESNMLLPIFPDIIVDKLREKYEFYDWKKTNGNTTVRLLTSWATPESIIDEFITYLKSVG